ncbi:unnamed protein product [Amoebophrya sp. A120]|nr:unnamed protein product [Amoebophrya sp. A120]|eukprot:GSA120T00015834001.1
MSTIAAANPTSTTVVPLVCPALSANIMSRLFLVSVALYYSSTKLRFDHDLVLRRESRYNNLAGSTSSASSWSTSRDQELIKDGAHGRTAEKINRGSSSSSTGSSSPSSDLRLRRTTLFWDQNPRTAGSQLHGATKDKEQDEQLRHAARPKLSSSGAGGITNPLVDAAQPTTKLVEVPVVSTTGRTSTGVATTSGGTTATSLLKKKSSTASTSSTSTTADTTAATAAATSAPPITEPPENEPPAGTTKAQQEARKSLNKVIRTAAYLPEDSEVRRKYLEANPIASGEPSETAEQSQSSTSTSTRKQLAYMIITGCDRFHVIADQVESLVTKQNVPPSDIYVMLTRCQPEAISQNDPACPRFKDVNFVSFLPDGVFQDYAGTGKTGSGRRLEEEEEHQGEHDMETSRSEPNDSSVNTSPSGSATASTTSHPSHVDSSGAEEQRAGPLTSSSATSSATRRLSVGATSGASTYQSPEQAAYHNSHKHTQGAAVVHVQQHSQNVVSQSQREAAIAKAAAPIQLPRGVPDLALPPSSFTETRSVQQLTGTHQIQQHAQVPRGAGTPGVAHQANNNPQPRPKPPAPPAPPSRPSPPQINKPHGKPPPVMDALVLTQHQEPCTGIRKMKNAGGISVFPALNSEYWNDQKNGFYHITSDAGPNAKSLAKPNQHLWSVIHVRLHIYYMWALGLLFLFYDHVAVLEDDLDVSVSLDKFFRNLIPVMDEDYSLISVSAWNDNGLEVTKNIRDLSSTSARPAPGSGTTPENRNSRHDALYVFRENHFGGLGWMTSRRVFEYYLIPYMSFERLTSGWDTIVSFIIDKLKVNAKTGYPIMMNGNSPALFGRKKTGNPRIDNRKYYADEMTEILTYHGIDPGKEMRQNVKQYEKDHEHLAWPWEKTESGQLPKLEVVGHDHQQASGTGTTTTSTAKTEQEQKEKLYRHIAYLETGPGLKHFLFELEKRTDKAAQRIAMLVKSSYDHYEEETLTRVSSLYPSVGLTHHRTTKTGISVKTKQNAKDLDKLSFWVPPVVKIQQPAVLPGAPAPGGGVVDPALSSADPLPLVEERIHANSETKDYLAWNYENYLRKAVGIPPFFVQETTSTTSGGENLNQPSNAHLRCLYNAFSDTDKKPWSWMRRTFHMHGVGWGETPRQAYKGAEVVFSKGSYYWVVPRYSPYYMETACRVCDRALLEHGHQISGGAVDQAEFRKLFKLYLSLVSPSAESRAAGVQHGGSGRSLSSTTTGSNSTVGGGESAGADNGLPTPKVASTSHNDRGPLPAYCVHGPLPT